MSTYMRQLMWSQVIVHYDKFALWAVLHWGKKRRQFYAFAITRESASDVYSKRRIIVVTKFKEGDFHRLRIQDIEDMLLLLVQGKNALNDRLKGIRMEYLPQTFWSQRDKANARAMIQAIDKRLKTRRIMQSLERFVGGRPYGGDLRLLQRTI
ncbi:hypothetical protein Tco_1055526 [Tanacetum coccineum]|uniref:Uncharacterized protein n=1 Tax=Tanacetum coccineum TaxID=301880 RepID=A0ABQ5H0T6_9ASTR